MLVWTFQLMLYFAMWNRRRLFVHFFKLLSPEPTETFPTAR